MGNRVHALFTRCFAMSDLQPATATVPGMTADATTTEAPPRSGWRFPLFLIGVLAASLTVLAYYELPREFSRWYLAAAEENELDGRHEQALGNLDQAIAWNPRRTVLLVQRAKLQQEMGHYDLALADVNVALERQPEESAFLELRSLIHQHLGQHASAVEDLKTLDRLSEGRWMGNRAQALNHLAYARALAKLELPEALSQIDEALNLAGNEPAYLDTRGFARYQNGQYDLAFQDLDPAVKGYEYLLAFNEKQFAARRRRFSPLDERRRLKQLEQLKNGVAVVCYHRSLALEKLGRPIEAAQDFARAKELLGREPDERLF